MYRPALLLCLCWLAAHAAIAEPPNADDRGNAYFERKIRPLLSRHCYECHSSRAKKIEGGLRLDSPSALLKGGDNGSLLSPGNPDESLLIQAIRYGGDIEMPPKGKLPQPEIDELIHWVQRGAPMPSAVDQPDLAAKTIDYEAGRNFWSFRPVEKQRLPDVSDSSWPMTRIDAFVLSEMERHGLLPSPPADRATLIRRVTFDLTGLPPTPEEVKAFVKDDSPDAYEKLVERLLQSPQYGEKWARWWLDMARYTDKTASWLNAEGQPHLYRDWVVEAFNDDMPYDKFIHRQLATDLMPETGPDDLPALGFVSLSPTYWKELKLPCEIIKVIVADEWEERVDATSRTFLGLTVACARCHDHKFDPISSADYYALAGVFASCRQVERPIISEAEYQPVRQAKAAVAKLEAKIAKLKKEKPQPEEKLSELTTKISEIRSSTPNFDTPMASALAEESLYVVRAGKNPQDGTRLDYRPGPKDLPLFIRGNPNRPDEVVPRRFLRVLSKDSPPFTHENSGRLDLARAITTDAAPLTARVLVNRVWLAHFGQGIVSTPSNFGRQGSPPTHPELLEDLAARFIADGWSLKKLHREILMSQTWRQSSQFNVQHAKIDPDNRWLSRMNRRRLDFEAWRDAMLSASGTLDLTLGGRSINLDDSHNYRRTLYATVHRRDMSTTLQIHDFPDPTQHSPQRSQTVTALQGLYALNGPLLLEQAEALVGRLRREIADDDQARIRCAYWLLYARAPTDQELQLGLRFLGDAAGNERATRWTQYAQVLFGSNEFLFLD